MKPIDFRFQDFISIAQQIEENFKPGKVYFPFETQEVVVNIFCHNLNRSLDYNCELQYYSRNYLLLPKTALLVLTVCLFLLLVSLTFCRLLRSKSDKKISKTKDDKKANGASETNHKTTHSKHIECVDDEKSTQEEEPQQEENLKKVHKQETKESQKLQGDVEEKQVIMLKECQKHQQNNEIQEEQKDQEPKRRLNEVNEEECILKDTEEKTIRQEKEKQDRQEKQERQERQEKHPQDDKQEKRQEKREKEKQRQSLTGRSTSRRKKTFSKESEDEEE